MNTVNIRTAVPSDLEAVELFYRQLDEYHAYLLPEIFQSTRGPPRPQEYMTGYIENEDADYLVADLHGDLVGFVSVKQASHPEYPLFRPRDFVLINDAFVAQAHRSQGIGAALFEEATRWAGARGLRYVRATVLAANESAHAFYLGLGFLPLSVDLELDLRREEEPVQS